MTWEDRARRIRERVRQSSQAEAPRAYRKPSESFEGKTLTCIIFQSAELDLSYLRVTLESLSHWNQQGGADTEFIVVSQLEDSSALYAIVNAIPRYVRVYEPKQPFVNGYPIWSVMEALHDLLPTITTQYVTCLHPEMLWYPGRLAATCDWLSKWGGHLAIGNLRRTGIASPEWKQTRQDQRWSVKVFDTLNAGTFAYAADILDFMPTSHWVYWTGRESISGPTQDWQEDIFFARTDWIRASSICDFHERMPFQDIYDVMGCAIKLQQAFRCPPSMCRMPLADSQLLHLWHPRHWSYTRPDIWQWFQDNPDYKGTIWQQQKLGDGWAEHGATGDTQAMSIYVQIMERYNPGGTIYNFKQLYRAWLKNGGRHTLAGVR